MENKDYPELEGTASPMDSQDEIFAAIESSVEDAIAQEDMMAAIESSVEQAIAREFSDETDADDPAEALPDPEETSEVEEPAADKAAATTEEAAEEIIIPTLPIVEESSEEAPSAPFDLSVPEDPALDAAEEESSAAEEFPDENLTDSRFLGEDADFQEEFQAAPTEEPAPVKERPVRKGRPRRKKGELFFGIPQIAVTCVWLAIILVTGVTLGRMLWVCAADILAFGREEKIVTVTVYESDSMEDITDKLHKAGLIRYPGLFNIYASLAVDEGEIQPGIWDLNTVYDYHALVNMMSPSSSRTIVEDVLIPEGFTCRQIFQLLEEKRICTAKDLAEYAANGELKDYWFLEGLERGYEYCLEGFLFPDTYDFYKNSSPRDVLEKLLDNFEYRFNDEMRAQIETLNANVTGGTFDIHKVVIVASMIEKETANNDESPLIASVIYNRLFNWGDTPAFLNIDASIVYALDGKTDLTAEDLRVESPYNTYTNIGLTPGAIANPGLASLKAALNPATSNYYFYVLNPAQGEHKFSTTLDEHNTFIASLE